MAMTTLTIIPAGPCRLRFALNGTPQGEELGDITENTDMIGLVAYWLSSKGIRLRVIATTRTESGIEARLCR